MTYDEIEAALRSVSKQVRALEAQIAAFRRDEMVAELDWCNDRLVELADQLNLTAHPVTVIRPRKKRR